MLRFCKILALLILLVQGCRPPVIRCPQVTIHVPPPVVAHTPDLNGCVSVETDQANAAGVVVARRDPFWFVLTAKHVVEDAGWLKVDGQAAELFAYSMTADLALLRLLAPRNYTAYPVADARLGEVCWVVGHPSLGRIVNRGHISKVHGGLLHNAGGCPGFSGGPVLGLRDGQPVVLGISVSCLAYTAGIGPFAIYSVYDSICRAESAKAIRALISAVPPDK